MSFFPSSLPPLPHSSPSHLFKTLPDLHPLFFVPPLEDRPQNPIVEALVEASPPLCQNQEVACGSEAEKVVEPDLSETEDENLWAESQSILQRSKLKNQNLSWDALRSTFPKYASATPFLSEQSNDAFDAIRHYVRPRLEDPSLQLRYVLPAELLVLLTTNMIGNSSPLYVWNAESEQFVPNGAENDKKLLILIEGLDDLASASIIRRFLIIGTLMRRLETLVASLQRQNANPTIHAFSTALSTVLLRIRSSLMQASPHPLTHLTSLWLHYADTETTLASLATMCCRGEHQHPPYNLLPDSPAGVLSHIYKHLERHIECRSSRNITAIVAYILTKSSQNYFADLGESLGLHGTTGRPWLRTHAFSRRDRRHAGDLLQLDDMDLDQSIESSDSDAFDGDDMPSFVPPELAEALPAARKSLRILQASDQSHHLCSTPTVCEWVWTSAAVEEIWQNRELSAPKDTNEEFSEACPGFPKETSSIREYKPDLQQFRLFDLEPGMHLSDILTVAESSSPTSSFETFVASFPDHLPSLTPTLQHLAKVVLQPFFNRIEVLSNSVLGLFLTSLQLETHLSLLRSYMLLTLPSFKIRLMEALFLDVDECKPAKNGMHTGKLVEKNLPATNNMTDSNTGIGLGIGLSHGLTEKNRWPPGGADLSFSLRSVIVDSLDERQNTGKDEEVDSVWKEAEVRLGFALRDLPVGNGQERWLNPMSIEALDFLYLDYKPPRPLDVIITPDILSKYQRIFTFLLRLLRAETVAHIAFRATFKSDGPLFAYSPQAQQLLVHLRFQVHAFITAFMAYIFDSVIGGNFDEYMHQLAVLRKDVTGESPGSEEREITDVVSLEKSHSDLLDRIMSACLLRTAQRAAGDALRDLLELVLQFGVLILKVQRGGVREAQGAEDFRELHAAFQKQMLVFIKAVQALIAKGQTNNFIPLDDLGRRGGLLGQMGSSSPFADMLSRIDATGWWRRDIDRQNRRAA